MRRRARRWSYLVLPPLAAAALGADSCGPPAFVTVPSGSFVMGSPADEPGREDDERQHVVTLTHAFALGRTEVTQADFAAHAGFDPSFFPVQGDGARHPVEQVSWFDAVAFANARSAAEGLPACYVVADVVCADGTPASTAGECAARGGIAAATVTIDGHASVYACTGYRLPTEAEFEHAARAGTTTALSSGALTHTSCAPLDPAADAIAWYCGNGRARTTQPVGGREANPWGLHDLAGNVAEWTWDRYVAAYPPAATDPEGGATGTYRVARGGAAWYDGAARMRHADRNGYRPAHRSRYVGFRLARTLVDGPAAPVPAAVRAALGRPAQDVARASSHAALSLPDELPVSFTRPDPGPPLTPAEIGAFTAELTGFWRDAGVLDWLMRTSRGIAPGNPFGQPDYALPADGASLSKANGVVTFAQDDWADNLTIPTSKWLNAVGSGYLASGHARMGELVEAWAKGYAALIDANLWDADDPNPNLMVRMIFPSSHPFTVDGRAAFADYEPRKGEERFDWNAQFVRNPANPLWGDIWLRTWRSKDDVPHLFRTLPVLRRVAAAGADADVREAAARAVGHLERFARDIVDSGYYIRTKDRGGNAVVPLQENGLVADLASFVEYVPFIADAECDNRLAAALVGYGDARGVECGNGFGSLYEPIAGFGHYYNWAIIWYFHLAAITNAFDAGEDALGLRLLEGLAQRADQLARQAYPNADDPSARADEAGYFVAAAAAGLPLTSEEARHVVARMTEAADLYAGFAFWDPWAPPVPDGPFPWQPGRDLPTGARAVRPGEILAVLEYCGSPYRNPTGAAFVDCAVVNDPGRWGETPG